MSDLFFLGKFDIYFYTMLEDVFVVLMLYVFIKLVLLSSMVELIWPTQFFNRRNSSSSVSYRLRTFTETLLKLRNPEFEVKQGLMYVSFN